MSFLNLEEVECKNPDPQPPTPANIVLTHNIFTYTVMKFGYRHMTWLWVHAWLPATPTSSLETWRGSCWIPVQTNPKSDAGISTSSLFGFMVALDLKISPNTHETYTVNQFHIQHLTKHFLTGYEVLYAKTCIGHRTT